MTPVSRRTLLQCGAFALGAVCARDPIQAGLVDPGTIHVRQNGSGAHQSLAAALAAAPAGDAPVHIRLGPGHWEEKLIIRRANVRLSGHGMGTSILSHATAAGHARPAGGNWGTYGSATLTVEAPGFAVRDLTIENSFDYVEDMRTGASGGAQAVALALGEGADQSRLDQVELRGHQDTFYLREGRALVRRCLIGGSVDFIFGGADALFENCEIRSRHRPGQAVQGFVVAPSTRRSDPRGFLFRDCRLTREAGVPNGSVYLGRPWRAGGNTELLGAASFVNSWMDRHIHPDGWTSMNYRGPAGYPLRLEPGDARFFEFGSRGPGRWQRRSGRQRGAASTAATAT